MLAYLFWHVPGDDADRTAYEASLRAFHAALSHAGDAVLTSTSFAVTGLPWINGAGPAYEDWYVVRDWNALGRLNDLAVAGARKDPHDRAAAAMASGAGGIYALRMQNDPDLRAPSAQWLAKPAGMSYEAFDALLEPLIARGCSLWRRTMVLGPGREFCLCGPAPVTLPAPLDALPVRRRIATT